MSCIKKYFDRAVKPIINIYVHVLCMVNVTRFFMECYILILLILMVAYMIHRYCPNYCADSIMKDVII